MPRIALVTALALWLPAPAAHAQAPSPSPAPPPPPWQLRLSASGVFDTNVDHELEPLDAYGGLLTGRLRYRRGGLAIEYRVGIDRFNMPTRWNRVTNRGAVRFTRPIDRTWSMELLGEISFRQRSEDQELGNFYVVSPALEYDHGGRTVRGFALYRLKQIREDVRDNVTNWYLGAEVEQEVGDGAWIVEYRRELNLAHDRRRTYTGHRLTVEYERELTARDELRIGLAIRPQGYRERLVEIDDETRVLRRDRRWIPEVRWRRALDAEVESVLEYSWERRLSNDPGREFGAHRFSISIVWAGVL